jgi:hypothetical protein
MYGPGVNWVHGSLQQLLLMASGNNRTVKGSLSKGFCSCVQIKLANEPVLKHRRQSEHLLCKTVG